MSAARLASAAKKAIVIPKRIQRGPTDVLKALSATVIPSQAKYVPFVTDEPYLRLRSIKGSALAKISGIKTAKLILNEHPEIFKRDESEPKVEDFQAPELFTDDMDLNEADLKWCIEHGDVKNAITAYNVMKSKNIDIDTHILQEFFELICYYNEADPPTSEELVEMHLGQQNLSSRPVWDNNGVAEKVFIELKERGDKAKAYNTMILGLSKYGQSPRAHQYFQEMNDQKLNACVEVYNCLLQSQQNVRDKAGAQNIETKNSIVDSQSQKLIDQMNAENVLPNRQTFNILLRKLIYSGQRNNTKQPIRLFNEMVSLNIQPSLTTYKSLLECLFKQERGDQDIIRSTLVKVIDTVRSKRHSIVTQQDDQDKYFFPFLMNQLKYKMRDPELAKKVHSSFMVNPSMSANTLSYYTSLFEISFTTDTMENSINLYEELVPYFYSPTREVFEAIIEALELYGGYVNFRDRITSDLMRSVEKDNVKNITLLIKDYKPSGNDRFISHHIRKDSRRS